jgi:hypothetical protein
MTTHDALPVDAPPPTAPRAKHLELFDEQESFVEWDEEGADYGFGAYGNEYREDVEWIHDEREKSYGNEMKEGYEEEEIPDLSWSFASLPEDCILDLAVEVDVPKVILGRMITYR